MKILLVQTAFLGDVVLSTPVITRLSELYPDATIDLLTTPAASGLFKYDRRLNNVFSFKKEGGLKSISSTLSMAKKINSFSYDIAYSLHRSPRTAILLYVSGIRERIAFSDAGLSWLYTNKRVRPKNGHIVYRNYHLVSDKVDLIPNLSLTAPPNNEVNQDIYKAAIEDESYILMVPGSAWLTKQWHWSRYYQLARLFQDDGYKIWLVGAKNEFALSELVRGEDKSIRNWCGVGSISDMLWMVKKAKAVVCNDSFALHVSSAFQKPMAAIFCATSPEFGFGPWQNPNSVVVEKIGLWCKPCRRHGSKKCPTATEECMRGVSANEVYFRLNSILKQAPKVSLTSAGNV